MSSSLFFDNKKYISAKEAGRLTGYSNDYVGQLSRLHKIESRQIGRVWYISEESILNYKNLPGGAISSQVSDSSFFSKEQEINSVSPTKLAISRLGEKAREFKSRAFGLTEIFSVTYPMFSKKLLTVVALILITVGVVSAKNQVLSIGESIGGVVGHALASVSNSEFSKEITDAPFGLYNALDEVTKFYSKSLAQHYVDLGGVIIDKTNLFSNKLILAFNNSSENVPVKHIGFNANFISDTYERISVFARYTLADISSLQLKIYEQNKYTVDGNVANTSSVLGGTLVYDSVNTVVEAIARPLIATHYTDEQVAKTLDDKLIKIPQIVPIVKYSNNDNYGALLSMARDSVSESVRAQPYPTIQVGEGNHAFMVNMPSMHLAEVANELADRLVYAPLVALSNAERQIVSTIYMYGRNLVKIQTVGTLQVSLSNTNSTKNQNFEVLANVYKKTSDLFSNTLSIFSDFELPLVNTQVIGQLKDIKSSITDSSLVVATAQNQNSANIIDSAGISTFNTVNSFFDRYVYTPIALFFTTPPIPVAPQIVLVPKTLTPTPPVVVTTQKPTTTIIERIIQQVPQTITNQVGGISQSYLDTRLELLNNSIMQKFYSLSTGSGGNVTNIYQQIAQSQRIDNLSGTTISNPTITGGSISGTSITTGGLTVNGVGTSTFTNGLDISDGCFSIDGTCISGSGGGGSVDTTVANSWTALQQFQSNASTTMLSVYNGGYFGSLGGSATTTIYGSATSTFGAGISATYLNITGSSATSTFASGIDLSGGCFSINGTCVGGGSFSNTIGNGGTGSTSFSPNSIIVSNAAGTALIATTSQLTVGSLISTTTASSYFNGKLGIASSTPWGLLSVNPNALGSGVPEFVVGSSTATHLVVTGAGNVGIGTTTPATLFHVVGAASAGNYVMTLQNTTSGGELLLGKNSTGNNIYQFQQDTLGDGNFFINDTNGVNTINLRGGDGVSFLDTGFNIGIGDQDADALFEVSASAGASDLFMLSSNDNNDGDRFIVKNSGNVGIGTTTPQWLLNPFSSTASQLALSAGAGVNQWAFRNAGGNFYLSTTTVVGTATTSTSALTIMGSTGNIGIGTSSPLSLFSIQGPIAYRNIFDIASSTGASLLSTSWYGGLVQNLSSSTAINVQDGSSNTVFAVDTTQSSTNAGIDITAGGSQTGNLLNLYSSGGTFLSGFTSDGGFLQNISSTSAFRIQNGSGSTIFAIDSTNGRTAVGTSTASYVLNPFSSTAPQLALSAGAGINQWAFRNAGGDLFISTTTVAGTATTSTSALQIAGSGFGTTTVRGLNISGQATSTSNVGLSLTGGCFAMNGTCITQSSGTVTSVDLSVPTGFTISGNPVTTSGTLALGVSFPSNGIITANAAGTGLIATTSQLTVGSLISTTTASSYFLGNLGIGTTTPQWLLNPFSATAPQLALSAGAGYTQWAFRNANGNFFLSTTTTGGTATSSTSVISILQNGGVATTTFNSGFSVDNGSILYDIGSGVTSIDNLSIGAMAFDTDAGSVTWADLPVSSSASAGTIEKYSAQIDGVPLLTLYSESDGVGTTRARRVAIGTTTPYAQLTIWATSTSEKLFEVVSSASSTLFTIDSAGKTGLASSTPWGLLSVNPDALGSGVPEFVVGSSTATRLIVTGGGNVGIGVSNPGAALEVNGVIRPRNNYTSDLGGSSNNFNTIYGAELNSATASLALKANNTTALTIDTSQRIGIGTTTPQWLLNPFSSTASQLSLSAGAGYTQWAFRNANGNFFLSTTTTGGTATSSTSVISILQNGGVATTTFSSGFSVDNGSILYDIGSGVTSIDNLSIGAMAFDTDAGQVSWVDLPVSSSAVSGLVQSYSMQMDGQSLLTVFARSNGAGDITGPSIGIGTTTPFGSLQISSTTASATFKPQLVISDASAGTNLKHWTFSSEGGNFYISTSSDLYATSSISLLSLIGSTGNVGVGTTTPWAGFSVNTNALGSGVPEFVIGSSTATHFVVNGAGNVGIGTTTPWRTLSVTGTVGFSGLTAGAGAGALCLSAENEVTYSAGATCMVSSERFKHTINNADIGLDFVNKLRPVTFEYNTEIGVPGVQFGFIAEEVELLDPRLVVHDASSTPYSVRYENLTAVLAKAIQELDLNIQSVASTTIATSTTASQSFVSGFWNNLFAKVTTWLADAGNGIMSMFAKEVNTETLCVSDTSGAKTCINKAQLDALLAGAVVSGGSGSGNTGGGSSGSGSGGGSSGGGNATTTPAVDTSVPVITIVGSNPATITLGSSYVDLGATVTDTDENGIVNNNLGIQLNLNGADVIDISLNTSTSTTHTIIYSATDGAGNTGTATRTVIVE